MGLDQYAYYVSKRAAIDDFHYDGQGRMYQDFTWRKSRFIHGWMEELFRAKGGTGDFNCQSVRLELADLDRLEQVIKQRGFKDVHGFFWGDGEYTDDDAEYDMRFVKGAKEHIRDTGGAVYYSSWW